MPTTTTTPAPEPVVTPEQTQVKVRKTATVTVQSAVALAESNGHAVFILGKHVVSVDGDGQAFYLGGGVDAPVWRQMRRVVSEG